ncbi:MULTISPECIES: APC family permease [Streptomyces]|uniref:APC family permease n=1 Tax=Streptomyces scabiei TaxID=1930 RepID=UPI0004E6810F|nr:MULTISPECIES: APC family permease [Streptomyces]MBP5865280.1 APC family permease [Streptomyces sp. LBUM 1484]MBP5872252.1 APC family permease [Streptomyces sp. LBUM 1485]KFG05445.1 amino acid permease [Streptomyces scabiei]MBP5874028.1 APC family permease [Streptomyces sp. LBUM 1477]MBP5881750.1 APC family permease [Streptomyces sp. LBUM 1487]
MASPSGEITAEPPVDPPDRASRRLKPVLGVTAVILLTVSCITPASSLFIIVPELLATQGSGVVIALLLGVVVSIAVGACYAELGTRTPSSGGEYAMITHTVGRTLGWLTFVLTAALLVIIPPVIALGTADYLSSVADLDRATTGAVVMLLAACTAILDVRANAFVTSCFLALEVLAAGVVAYLGFAHAERPVSTLVRPEALTDGTLSPFTLGVVMSGLVVAMLIVNGFGTASYLAEEMVEPRHDVARAVFGSIFIAATVIIVPTAAVVVGAGSLKDLGVLGFPDFVKAWAGPGVAAAVSAVIALAILNAVIVMVLQNGRVMYASGRDQAWPAPVNAALTRLHPRFNTPVVATLAVALPGAVFAYFFDIESLLGITGVIVAAVYLLLAVGALAARRRPHAGWKMPLWPLAPVVVIIALAYALSQSAPVDLAVTVGIVAAALGYEVLYLRPRRDTRFLVDAREDR